MQLFGLLLLSNKVVVDGDCGGDGDGGGGGGGGVG